MSRATSKPDLTFVTLIHQSLRADTARLAATIAALHDVDRVPRLPCIGAFFDHYCDQLVTHHRHEDELFFPALVASAGADKMHLHELDDQHHELDTAIRAVRAKLAALADPANDFVTEHASAADAVTAITALLDAHLTLVEESVLPLVEMQMAAGDYKKLEARARKATPRPRRSSWFPGSLHTPLPTSAEPCTGRLRPRGSSTGSMFAAIADSARRSLPLAIGSGGSSLACNNQRTVRMRSTTHRSISVSKSIAVFGAGPGLGQAVARRYAREGYAVTLVGRRSEPLDRLATDLTSAGATAHVITADLSDTGDTPRLAEQIRAKAGNLDALYYAPTPDTGFVSAANLTPQHAQNFMPLIFYTMLALVQEFLPHMLEQGDGAILTAQGGSTVQGLPNMSGPSPAQAAQRNYLQALHAEVAQKGVYVGMLYIGAAIKSSAFHAELDKAKAAGDPVWEMPTVDPEHLADLLWTMHRTKGQREVIYP